MNQNIHYVIVKRDGVTSNINGFDFSWEYIAKSGKKSPTYLKLENAKFYSSDGNVIEREFQSSEQKKSGLVLARLAIQVYESQLDQLTEQERRTLQTDGTGKRIGIWNSKKELIESWGNGKNSGTKPSKEYVADMYLGNAYPSTANAKYFIYNAGLFDSLCFAKNMIEHFGKEGDYFRIEVTQSQPSNSESTQTEFDSDSSVSEDDYISRVARTTINSYNIILRGAPGTGKSYLAKQIASLLVSNGRTTDDSTLSVAERAQIEFVQFHPSYDYTDFVEGLRPYTKNDNVGFKLEDGTFKAFCKKARSASTVSFELEGFGNYLKSLGNKEYENYFYIIEQLLGLKEYSGEKVEKFPAYQSLIDLIEDIDSLKEFDRKYSFRQWIITPMNYLEKYYNMCLEEHDNSKKYVFIIDEVNRGEISKIFGELFFSIDPGYRGPAGSIRTQYANLHPDDEGLFYVPENVYIIGTMNDIDRSVDSFDFAMRRRFRFINITAHDSIQMLEKAETKFGNPLLSESIVEESIKRMSSINALMSSSQFPDLNDNYHIGASYFLKLSDLDGDFDVLWSDYLEPLLKEYLRGSYDVDEQLRSLRDAYELQEQL